MMYYVQIFHILDDNLENKIIIDKKNVRKLSLVMDKNKVRKLALFYA